MYRVAKPRIVYIKDICFNQGCILKLRIDSSCPYSMLSIKSSEIERKLLDTSYDFNWSNEHERH